MRAIQNIIEFDKFITPDGETYNFHDGFDHFLMSFSGFGMPPINYITERGPYQHGETPIDFFLQPRVLQMVHRRQARSRSGYWDARKDLLDYLRPNRYVTAGVLGEGALRKILPNGDTRDIDVLVESGPEFSARGGGWDEFAFLEQIRFIANDPTFYDPTLVSSVFSLSSLAHLVFPVTLTSSFGIAEDGGKDMLFFSSSIDDDDDFQYMGTWLTYPTIVITGPAENPTITNQTTGKKIELDYNVSAAEVVTIDLAYRVKTVENGSGTNLIGTVTTDSDLGDFALVPAPLAPAGVNTIQVAFGGADSNSEVEISYYTRYIGI